MNWYRKYARRLYDPKNLSANPRPEAQQIFNIIKSRTDAVVTAYHGCSSKAWESALQVGYLLAPDVRGVKDNEFRHMEPGDSFQKGTNQVFITTNKTYALGYAKRNSNLDDSEPLILTLQMPIYAMTEIRSALFSPQRKIYNESGYDRELERILDGEYNERDTAVDKANRIIEMVRRSEKYHPKTGYSEFTGHNAIPTKWVKNVENMTDEIERTRNKNMGLETNEQGEIDWSKYKPDMDASDTFDSLPDSQKAHLQMINLD